jgi:molybdopterin-dependent oxidoreductase alpha subunit
VTTQGPDEDFDGAAVRAGPPRVWAAGLPSIYSTAREVVKARSVATTEALLRLNQSGGFDCPGCAWPEPAPADRKIAEFCENGAKHVASETTGHRVGTALLDRYTVAELDRRSDWWLEQQGRLVEPLVKSEGSEHYRVATWDEALDLVASELLALDSADGAVFYTSGRASNEAAFLYQLFARSFGTNNLPDCSNLCHESSGAALSASIGVGKGSCTLEDLLCAELIVICGQNPGTNHPRMLTHLEAAKRRGATIVAVNPLPEAGLLGFKNPQSPVALLRRATPIADEWLPVRLAGDQALFLGVAKALFDSHRGALDTAFLEAHTSGSAEYRAYAGAVSWEDIERASGLGRARIEDLARRFAGSRATIVCWAMGLTQHRNSVPMIREIVNVLLLQGNIGKPGAGVFPVRGHSNVQGDRTMGIWEKMPASFLDALRREFRFDPPQVDGYDAVAAINAIREGRARALLSLGGNLVRAISDSAAAEVAMSRLRLSVSLATKLNRSHTAVGQVSVVLPVLGRTESDPGGAVSVEDSIGQVHLSRGRLAPAGPALRSETSVVCALAARVLGDRSSVPWDRFSRDYAAVRDSIARVVPGFEEFNAKVAAPGGFLLPHPPRDSRTFPTPSGKAVFSISRLAVLDVPPGRLILQTIRSHDQFNTTVYGHDDRYRGIAGGRRVVMVNPDDVAALGLTDGQKADVVSEWHDGTERRYEDVRVVAYPIARDCCAAYYPEANVLVPLDSVADISNTPTFKSVVVRIEPRPGR